MSSHTNHPIIWNEELGVYIYTSEGYNGASTKQTGRVASALSLEHFKVRQLELIVKALANQAEALASQKVVNDMIRKEMTLQNNRRRYYND